MNLLRIAALVASRFAARSTLLQGIDQAFESAGVYPPVMRQVGPRTYEGEVDDGWTLQAEDSDPPKYKLNGVPGTLKGLVESFRRKDSAQPTKSAKRVLSLFPMADGEEGGEHDRYYDVDIWDTPDGKRKVRATLVEGPPIPEATVEYEYDLKAGPPDAFVDDLVDKALSGMYKG